MNYDRFLIMNTQSAPATVWCEMERKRKGTRPLIDLTTIEIEEEKTPQFEDFMEREDK